MGELDDAADVAAVGPGRNQHRVIFLEMDVAQRNYDAVAVGYQSSIGISLYSTLYRTLSVNPDEFGWQIGQRLGDGGLNSLR